MTGGKLIGLFICVILALITGNKLVKMSKIQGWLPGARQEIKIITGKEEIADKYGSAYWIAWDNISPSVVGNHRTNLKQNQWESLSVGDKIEVYYVGKSASPYIRDGIFVSKGNFVFDSVLFTAELTGMLFCGFPFFKRNISKGVTTKQKHR